MIDRPAREIWLFRQGEKERSLPGQLAGHTLDLGCDIAATVETSVGETCSQFYDRQSW